MNLHAIDLYLDQIKGHPPDYDILQMIERFRKLKLNVKAFLYSYFHLNWSCYFSLLNVAVEMEDGEINFLHYS